jgi:hypothetical protein
MKIQDNPIRIVVLKRGFIYVGRCRMDDDTLVITNAVNVRRWGTTRGLGELVNGPTADTVLDPVGTVRAPERAVIHTIDVREDAWAPKLAS